MFPLHIDVILKLVLEVVGEVAHRVVLVPLGNREHKHVKPLLPQLNREQASEDAVEVVVDVLDLLLDLLDLLEAAAPLLAVQIEHFELELGHGGAILLVKKRLERGARRLERPDQVQSLRLVQMHQVLTQLIADGVETLHMLLGGADFDLLDDELAAELVDVGGVPACERDILDVVDISERHENLTVVHHDTFGDFSGHE